MRALALLLALALAGCAYPDGLAGGTILVERTQAHDAALPLDEEPTRREAPRLAQALDAAAASADGRGHADVQDEGIAEVYDFLGRQAEAAGHRDWDAPPVNRTVLWEGEAYTVHTTVA